MQATEWFIGCSGFYYKEWKELFYPKGWPQAKWFEYYCRHFNTLEINNTFYRFPEVKNLQSWFLRSPEHFTFSVKAPRIITHLNKFAGTENTIKEFYEVVKDGLHHKVSCILFQLPASIVFSEEMLQLIISQLDTTYNNVIEFRHQSWWQPQVYEVLNKNNITFCSVSFPNLSDAVISNTSLIYYRFHGAPKLYYSIYSHEFLQEIINTIKTDSNCKKAFLYFNNTASAAALNNAKFVQDLV